MRWRAAGPNFPTAAKPGGSLRGTCVLRLHSRQTRRVPRRKCRQRHHLLDRSRLVRADRISRQCFRSPQTVRPSLRSGPDELFSSRPRRAAMGVPCYRDTPALIPDVSQLRGGFQVWTLRKRNAGKALDFPSLQLRTRRSGVQISPGAPSLCVAAFRGALPAFCSSPAKSTVQSNP